MPQSPLEAFLEAFGKASWRIDSQERIGSGPNPTRVSIRKVRAHYGLLVYAWRITSEGKGRTKTDYRVQTTRSHDGPLLTPASALHCGIGWDEERGVFAAFDTWIKRNTGTSSSVHIPRSLLDGAQQAGWATLTKPEYGPEAAFNPANIERYLGWILELGQRRLLPLNPSELQIDGDTAVIIADRIRQPYSAWMRLGDHLILRRRQTLLDTYVWRISSIDAIQQTTTSANYNRDALRFTCERIGVIQDEDWALGVSNDLT